MERREASAGLVAIETRYRESRRVDAYGNDYRLRGVSWWDRRGRLDPRLFYDVWFAPRRWTTSSRRTAPFLWRLCC